MSLSLRPEQAEIARYRGGLLAVSAVPGSGKTHTLAALAVNLIAEALPPESEVLVVTFTNSAVDNIRARIRRFLKARNLPDGGYRVFTLHSLANAILRERPDLAGLTDDYRVDDEISGRQAMPDAAKGYIVENHAYWQSFLPTNLDDRQRQKALEGWQETTERLGYEITRLAKNLKLTPADLKALMAKQPVSDFLRIGAAIYERYDRILNAGGRLDFDDLIWGAIRALCNDDAFRRRLGERWSFILEDEAQDSTPLQEEILALLSRDHGNWVRVGDPNQAIMTTFTASDVRLFRTFRRRPDVHSLSLTVSGRSALPIIQLANALVLWAVHEHPEPRVREEALSAEALIRPTAPDDPQQNPPTSQAKIWVHGFRDVE
ncbi:MAG: ATP-dependent helicase, partial [Thermoflexales bacterium]|nr:ATP-dependent helicase [Thermoflexales bacterium]